MNFEQARFNMVEQQIRPWDVLDPDVLDLLMTVRREEFVPQAYRNLAFADIEVPVGNAGSGQCMLKPVIEGKVLQALKVKAGESVLEIGTGSGYFAALLAARSEHVRTFEINPELVALARGNLERYGCSNVDVVHGDGLAESAGSAAYDVIMVSGGVSSVPALLLAQLKPGGRLFAFVGEAPVMKARLMTCVGAGEFASEDVFETLVPVLQNGAATSTFEF